VKIALLERFSDPSRRCDPSRVAAPDDDVLIWDLSRSRGDHVPSFRDFVRVAPAWATLPMPTRSRWRLLRLCAGMRGWRRAALIHVPAWMRALQTHEIDQVACFSAREFELAHQFAEATGRPCSEMLAHGTQYFGEFAFEHLAVIPYAYWLHQRGRLEYTVATPDTRCFYYFSPDHTEVAVDRRYVPITEYPIGEPGSRQFDRAEFPTTLDATQWSPPPYRDVYGNDERFCWDKPPVVVCNKTSEEYFGGSSFTVNCLDNDALIALIRELTPRYTVIYNRPRARDIVADHADVREPGDIEAVKRAFPDVITIQELHTEHFDLTFNELQLRVFATCQHFISVLGGASYLASYFGGTNIVYAQRGWEVDCGAFDGWFRLFSGARVLAVSTISDLIRTVRCELLPNTT
jgi:hypothetical protein